MIGPTGSPNRGRMSRKASVRSRAGDTRRAPPTKAMRSMPEADQVLGGQRHAEPEVGADVVGALPADAPKHLHDGNAVALQFVDDVGCGAFRRREQDAVDPMLAHASDEAALAGGQFCGVGDEGDPAGLIEGVIDSRRELGVERIGDFADDQPDGMREARAQIRRGAMVDIAKRVDGRLNAGPGGRRNQRTVAQHQRDCRRRHPCVPGDILYGWAQALPLTIICDLDRSNRIYPAIAGERQWEILKASNGAPRSRPAPLAAIRGPDSLGPRVAILAIDDIHAVLSIRPSAGRP